MPRPALPHDAARRLLQRLLVVAVAACSTSDSTSPATTGAGGTDAGTGGTGGSLGSSGASGSSDVGGTGGASGSSGVGGAPAGGAGGAVDDGGSPDAAVDAGGPTSECHVGKACAPDDTCSYPSGQVLGGFSLATWCACVAGAFACPIDQQGDGGTKAVTGCVYGVTTPCPATDSPDIALALGKTHSGGCGLFAFAPGAVGVAEVSSDGTPACCYPGMIGLCVGRPLRVAGRPRVAALTSSSAWSVPALS